MRPEATNVPLRVIHLCSSSRVGGVETSVLAMIESLRASAPAWTVAVIAPERTEFSDRVRQTGCEPIVLAFPRSLARFGEVSATRGGTGTVRAAVAAGAYGLRLRRTLERFAPDVVHAHGIKMQVLSRWAAPRRSRVVWHLHDYIAGRESSRRALRGPSGRCDAAIANSRSVAEDFRLSVPGEVPVSVIYNGVDLARFAPEGHRLDLDRLSNLAPAPAGTVRIGLPATFGRWKGHDVFLRALGRLPGDAPWRGYIIGGPVYRTIGSQWSPEGLQATARQLGLGTRVGFTGLVHDMPSAMRALDVVVHASTQPEPFGMTIAEAMSCGRAAVVAPAGGAAELVQHEVDAICYGPGDDGELAAVLTGLIADAERRAQLGIEARRSAVAKFDARRLGSELRRVYESLDVAH